MISLLSMEEFLTKAAPGKTNNQEQQQYLQAASEIIAEVQAKGIRLLISILKSLMVKHLPHLLSQKKSGRLPGTKSIMK
ncbi:hypothetical protein JCM21714_437 [Gracilibacillus boraciitolerans JCM 21714]|uniref:Uncharacterized protein n=1 Tax=Gracilibacillus boraciitolerans JCM 21714 TaxID=1298598 RepID=W4VE65_9BACI|nr:hypothetical protein JCM21714_437 [Gracilibacillus boraciitolerans JCM 21714]